MKSDNYTQLPSWEISIDELLSLLNRGQRTLEIIAEEAPWFEPGLHKLDAPAHPIFRTEEALSE